MRIVQLSDIHLSSNNIYDLENYYLEALVKDLLAFHQHNSVDLVIFTGDLVDKGGNSLKESPYETFKKVIITPIVSALKITDSQVLMIPGNHDIDRNQIELKSEFYLANTLTRDGANKLVNEMKMSFTEDNNRIKRFKEFEKEFHKNTPNYVYSNSESSVIINTIEGDIGISLVNDSWRCSSDLQRQNHFIGSNQLFNTAKIFSEAKTQLNVAVFHHPLEAINEDEKEEIENILKSKNFSFSLFGHSQRDCKMNSV
ncbi:3',5'-cyclic adenosine monophosphate phosphodiesterase CpdA [Dyadobacter sp. CECT 9275]|uniref:3',5'-cyclic adenosine monophosphate phosphodiesterase CpdA n=1 Tax=Dyadobacter helix TaxID=2822344 RepID=A0A916NBC5_9BACT|nr:metallophosphoesterase [Dyadobacter sp. CECT 9275]CAG4997306.1 3',5'-cyclic adenosine monophosphate phosphodiesterase CpdA [Dyadobacter sp. CECT 9275]